MFYRNLAFLLTLVVLFSCKQNTLSIINLDEQEHLIPEGIAIDPQTHDIFLSSLLQDKVVRFDIQGNQIKNIIEPREKGYSSGVGMIIKNNLLWALAKVHNDNQSALFKINIETNELIKRYTTKDSISNYFNDLAVDNQLNAYITDTQSHKIYKLNNQTEEIEIFLEHDQIKYPNGITISSDQTKLFIDSYTSGIRIVDIQTKEIINNVHLPSAKKGIDGLKYYKNNLYAIINGSKNKDLHSLVKYSLSDNEKRILKKSNLIINHPLMNVPTTLDVANDNIYLLANSQMENYDDSLKRIINKDILTKTYIIKYSLK